ncbi:hypothetical protein KWH10_09400 [Xanthomonas campestris pv. clerodendri]|nr:hypothetical protein [Xanthomonas campestris pv. clerodendri]
MLRRNCAASRALPVLAASRDELEFLPGSLRVRGVARHSIVSAATTAAHRLPIRGRANA